MYRFENANGEKLTAILYSPGYGAGWGTWNNLEVAYNDQLIEWLVNNIDELKDEMNAAGANDRIDISERFDRDDFENFVETLYPQSYYGGLRDLTIYFVPTGSRILIEEYDGSESIEFLDDLPYIQT